MSAIGRLSDTSRRIEPPTAETTPTNTAGTSGTPSESAFVVPIAPKRPIVRASSAMMSAVQPREDAAAAACRAGRPPSRPAGTSCLQIAAGSWLSRMSRRRPPPSPTIDADERDAEQVDAALA